MESETARSLVTMFPAASPGAAGPRPPGVLILARYFPPAAESGAARPGRFARYLPQYGYEPMVVCGGPPAATDSPSVHRVPSPSPPRRARFLAGLGAATQRGLLPYNDQLPWAAHAAAEAAAMLDRQPTAVVLSTSPPAGVHLAALRIKWRYGLPWVADFRDPLLGNPFRSRRWPFPYDAWLERLIFRHADALVANTDAVADMWRRRYPEAAGKIALIWNGFDPEDRVAPRPTPGDRRVLAHVGSLYGGRHPGSLLAALARLISQGELDPGRLCVRLVGPITDDCLQINRDAMHDLEARGCLEYDGQSVPPDQARRAAAEADYLLLLDLNERGTGLQVPAKLFEYLQIGRPLLAFTRRDSPTDRILARSGVPYRAVYHDDDEARVESQVISLLDLSPEPTRASDWFEDTFDGRSQTRMLARIFDSLRGLGPRQTDAPEVGRPLDSHPPT